MNEPLRVVIVEDEAVVLMQLEMMLEDAGCAVIGTAMTATEAITLIRETLPELVLLDLHLKDGSSGLDVARAVRDQDDLTVVFLTANALKLTDDMEGAAGVIVKPFNRATIEGSLAYLEECVRRPPPQRDLPLGVRLAPAYLARLDGMRPAAM